MPEEKVSYNAGNRTTPTTIIKDRREPGWYRVDNELLRNGYGKEFGPYFISVYNALALHADKQDSCYPSHETIAELTGMSRPTVIKMMEKLESLNLIRVSRKNGYVNSYTLTPKSEWIPVNQVDRGVNDVYRGVNQVDTNKTHIIRQDKEKSDDFSHASGDAPDVQESGTRRTRKKSDLDILKSELVSFFSEKSGLTKPRTRTKKECSAAACLWWTPLVQIADCVDRDIDRARSLIEWSLRHADEQKLTIKAPISIVGIAIAEQAKRLRQNGHGKSNVPELCPGFADS